jgi:hypothetical protein
MCFAGEALIALKGAVAANGFGTSKLRSWKVTGEREGGVSTHNLRGATWRR